MEGSDFNFEDKDLAEIFYPKITTDASFLISKLRIRERDKKARYTLDYKASSINQPTTMDQMSELSDGNYFELDDLSLMKDVLRKDTRSFIQNITEVDQDLYNDENILDMDEMGADKI